MSDATPAPKVVVSADWIPLVAWAVGFVALAMARVELQLVPQDLSAYLAAADVLSSGLGSPYELAALERSPLYQGFPYLYYPGFHWLLSLLAALPLGLVLVLETVLRGLLAALVVRFLVRRLHVPLPWQGVVPGLLCLDAFVTDLYVGNLTVMMSALWCLAVMGREGTRTWRASRWLRGESFSVLSACIGFFTVLKPMWLLPTGFVLCWQRDARGVMGLALGVLAALGLGAVAGSHELVAWWEAIARVRGHWQAFDLGSVEPALMLVAACAWGVGALEIVRSRRAGGWLWGCASVLVWPRIGLYSYVLVIPLLLWSVKRFGKWRGALLALPFSLLPSFLLAEYTLVRMCLVYVSTLLLGALWLLDGDE